MGLETSAYVPDLVKTNPANTDQRKQGDDHFRNLKTALQQSFELLGPVFTTGGTSTALTVTTSHANTPAYKDRHLYTCLLHTAIGAAATINWDSLGAKGLQKLTAAGWTDVAANDYPSGAAIVAYYHASANKMRIVSTFVQADSSVFALLASSNVFTADQTIKSTDAGAGVGPTLTLYRDSASPAASDVLGRLLYDGEDSAGNQQNYAGVQAEVVDATSTTEDGLLNFLTVIAGTYATRMKLGHGLYMDGATGGDKGAGTINAQQVYVNNVPVSTSVGKLIQRAYSQTGAHTTGSTPSIPYDNTTPQSTEGTEWATLAITPTSGSNDLYVEVVVNLSGPTPGGTSAKIIALFLDSEADARAVAYHGPGANNFNVPLVIKYKMAAGSTSAKTFKVRVGMGDSSTWSVNGEAGSAKFNSTAMSSIQIDEVAP